MKQTLFPILFFLFIINTVAAQNNSKAVWKIVNNMIYRESEFEFTPEQTLAIGVIVNDSVYFRTFGAEDKKTKQRLMPPPTDSSIYELGAFTKIFTGTILAKAVTEGKVKLEDTVQNFLPKGYELPTFKGEPIRFIDLATHTSGLLKYPHGIGQKETEDNNLFKNYSDDDAKEFLKTYNLHEKPGTKYRYSHLGFHVLTVALLHIYKTKDYETLVQEQIFKPLQLNSTTTQLTDEQKKRLLQGHSRIGKPVKPWEFQSFQGSMAAKSTMHDLLKWVRFQLDTPTDWQKTVELARKPQRPGDLKYVRVALGWHSLTLRKKYYDVVVHSGQTDGHRVYIGYVKETRTGVIVMSNTERDLNGIGPFILQMINHNFRK